MVQAKRNHPVESSQSPAVASCKVCWACRGLVTEPSDLSVKNHLQFCSQEIPLDSEKFLEHYVCDRSDYVILLNLKRSLDKFLESGKSIEKLQSVLPKYLVENLTDLRDSALPYKPKINQVKSYHDGHCEVKPSYIIVSNKESQTKLETSYSVSHEEKLNINSIDISICSFVQSEVSETFAVEAVSENTTVPDSPSPSTEETVSSKSCLDSEDERILSKDCYTEDKEDKVTFVCRLCSHRTSSGKQMLRHQRSHNDGDLFKCEPCNFTALWRKEWKIHLQQKHRNKVFLCYICAAEFQTNIALDQHLASAHADNDTVPQHRLQCQHCDYVAREMASLKEHMRKHTGEKILCPHKGCKFASYYTRSLNKHLKQKHASEKTQVCYICGFQTRHASSLTKHITLVHRDLKPYKCAQCTFTALYPSEVIAHAKSKHFKHKRFACPKCPFKTSYQLAIQKHVARHNETDNFDCLVCGEILTTRNKARKHMEKEHGYTQFQVLKEPSWEKVNANEFKIKEDDFLTSVDLNNIVVLNETSKSIKKSKVKSSKSKGASACTSSKDVFELPESILQETSIPPNNPNGSASLAQDENHYTGDRQPTKGGNPMLSGTTADLDDNENSLSSLFDLMSDFPRPTTLNRCQSASTLMFASLSPHLIDRPLTPDFFTDSPSVASFFPSFSTKNLEADGLSLGTESAYENNQQILPSSSLPSLSSQPAHFRTVHACSPLLPSLLCSPQAGSARPIGQVSLSPSLEQEESNCMEVDSVFSHLEHCAADATTAAVAFATLGQNFTSEIQAAVASIPISREIPGNMSETNGILQDEPPFASRPNL